MTITGRRINISIDVETEVDGHAIIPHSMLEEIADNYNIEYTYETVFCNGVSAAIKCIAAKDEFKSEAFGESNNKNLDTDIGKKYPVIMAAKRAFDRAVIRLFGFDVYSDSEIAVTNKAKKEKDCNKPVEEEKHAEPPKYNAAKPTIEQNAAPTATIPVKENEKRVEDISTSVKEAVAIEDVTEIPNVAATTKSTVKTAEDFFANVSDDVDGFFDSMAEIESEEENDVVTTISEAENASIDVVSEKNRKDENDSKDDKTIEEEKPEYLKCIVKVGSHRTKNITMEDLYKINKEDLIWLSTVSMTGEFFEKQKNAALATITYMESLERN